MVPAVMVVPVPAFFAVACVPNVRKLLHSFWFLFVNGGYKAFVYHFAVAKPSRVYFKTFV